MMNNAAQKIFSWRLLTRIWGIITILFLPTYLIRVEVLGVPTNVLDVLMVAFLVFSVPLVLVRFPATQMKKYIRNPLVGGGLLVLLGVFLSAAQGGFSASELGIMKSWFVLPFFFVSVYAALFQIKQKNFDLVLAYFFSATIVSIIAMGYLFLGEVTYDGRLKAFYESPNHLAMYIAPMLVLGWFLARFMIYDLRSTKKKIKIQNSKLQGIYIIVGVTTFVLYLTQSYGAWIAVFVSILVGEYIFLRKKQAFKRVFMGGAIVFLMVILSQCTHEKWNDLVAFDERSSLSSRAMIWRAALDIGADNWFFGIGPGNFQEKYLEYQQYYPPYLEWAVPQPHNLYIAFWLQTGLIGFVGFLIIIFTVAAATRPLCSHPTAVGNEKTAILLDIAVFCAFLTILIHGLVDTPYWKNDLSVVFWILVLLSTTWRRADM